jgi:hypothetical protein
LLETFTEIGFYIANSSERGRKKRWRDKQGGKQWFKNKVIKVQR